MPVIEFEPDRPVWRQVADVLTARIEDGTYRPRQPIPSENQLIGEFGIARGTARKVVAYLRDQGLIYTVANLGSFVAPQDTERPAQP